MNRRQRRMTMEPPQTFTPWVPWQERGTIEGVQHSGVYALAHFEGPPQGPADPLAQQIIYLGQTCSNLRRRWRQFRRAAFEGKPGHSGGLTYRETFGDEGQRLYVAACPVQGLQEPLRSLYIRYLKRRLLWEYALRWRDMPKCNSQ